MHPWFNDYDWDGLFNQKIESPIKPSTEDNFDKKVSESDWKDTNEESL